MTVVVDPCTDDAARLAHAVGRVGEGDPGQRQVAAGWLDQPVIGAEREVVRETGMDGFARQDRVAPRRAADGSAGLRLDEREGVHRCIADGATGQPAELGRLVDDLAVDIEEGHLLEADDARIERIDEPGDAFEPLDADMPPPGGREGLTRADGGPDVPRRDA